MMSTIERLNHMNKPLKAIIIKGNPKYINTPLARKYYHDIETFLKENGVHDVKYDAGDDQTLPPLDADLYIGHSRGCSRYQYMPEEKKKVFLKFGVPDGIIHPVDLKWCNGEYVKGKDKIPPKEHFMLIQEQKDAILALIKKLNIEKAKQPNFSKW